MTISAIYSVFCQGSRRGACSHWAGEADTKREALSQAKNEGFKRVRVENGSMWDFCPACYNRYKTQIEVAK